MKAGRSGGGGGEGGGGGLGDGGLGGGGDGGCGGCGGGATGGGGDGVVRMAAPDTTPTAHETAKETKKEQQTAVVRDGRFDGGGCGRVAEGAAAAVASAEGRENVSPVGAGAYDWVRGLLFSLSERRL